LGSEIDKKFNDVEMIKVKSGMFRERERTCDCPSTQRHELFIFICAHFRSGGKGTVNGRRSKSTVSPAP
jgi:hypothetical protein